MWSCLRIDLRVAAETPHCEVNHEPRGLGGTSHVIQSDLRSSGQRNNLGMDGLDRGRRVCVFTVGLNLLKCCLNGEEEEIRMPLIDLDLEGPSHKAGRQRNCHNFC